MNLRSFQFNRVYLDPRNMSNAGDFSWSWILKGFYLGSMRGRKIRRGMFTPSIKRQIRRFHVVVVQWTSKKCTKSRDARAELLFWSLNLLSFWSRRCGCLSSLIRECASAVFCSRPGQTGQIFSQTNARSSWPVTQGCIFEIKFNKGQVIQPFVVMSLTFFPCLSDCSLT